MRYAIANWKMNMILDDIRNWYVRFADLVHARGLSENVKVILAPASIHIPITKEVFKDLPVKFSSQDVSVFEKGAHTGSLGAFQIKDFCDYSIVGHSEKKEDLETVVAKRDAALQSGLTPVVCFTEPNDCTKVHKEGVFIAWEDPSNISVNGEYRPKDSKEIDEQSKSIKNMLDENAVLIYGGSVNKDNVSDLATMEQVQGVLVGNASLDPEHFFEIALKLGA